jgi:bifunctional DNA-binding transcriptional regulator/antitoxin component of YhaV-PrlF toxin-antitoxin module
MKTFATVDPNRAIVIPDAVTKAAGLHVGQTVAVTIEGPQIVIEPQSSEVWLERKGKVLVVHGGKNNHIPTAEAVRMAREDRDRDLS